MKKAFSCLMFVFILILISGCDLFNKDLGSKTYDKELTSATGNWYYLDENKEKTDTYFSFDGTKDKMTFEYIEHGKKECSGVFRIIYKTNMKEASSPLSIILNKGNSKKEDVIYAYTDNFETSFTQFSIIKEEREEDKNDGRNYAHIYRISELPYKVGTYVLDDNKYEEEQNNYLYASKYLIPNGTYILNNNVSLMFFMGKPFSYGLFKYVNKDNVVEGVYTISDDKKTIYLYIEHDPYEYIKKEDRQNYDTSFSQHYPPDFYLRGNFEILNNSIQVDSLYHHEYSPTTIQDSVFVFGIYTK